jgi:hypothetical protein
MVNYRGAEKVSQGLRRELLSGIPVEDLRKRKKQSKLALSAMREIQEQKQGGSFLWWLLGAGLFMVVILLLMSISF